MTLCSFLNKAEQNQQEMKGPFRSGFEEELPYGIELRKRQTTPEEQLRYEDEVRFAESEDQAARKSYKEDGAWGYKKPRR